MALYEKEVKEIKTVVSFLKTREPYCSGWDLFKIILDRGPSCFCGILKDNFSKKDRDLILKFLKECGNIYGPPESLAESSTLHYGLVSDVKEIFKQLQPKRTWLRDWAGFGTIALFTYISFHSYYLAIMAGCIFECGWKGFELVQLIFRQRENENKRRAKELLKKEQEEERIQRQVIGSIKSIQEESDETN